MIYHLTISDDVLYSCMNYKIIADKDELQKFINWLPETTERQKYYVSLLCRKKYNKDCLIDKAPLSRKVTHKKDLFNKIWQMEVPFGAYSQKDNSPVPQDALVCYMTINRRDLWKASINSLKAFADVVGKGEEDFNQNPQQLAMSEIHRASSYRLFTIFDVDEKNPDTLNKMFEIVGKQPYIETRGGYHVLVRHQLSKDFSCKSWYQELSKYADVVGDEMSPIPGTLQGGTHVVKFYENC